MQYAQQIKAESVHADVKERHEGRYHSLGYNQSGHAESPGRLLLLTREQRGRLQRSSGAHRLREVSGHLCCVGGKTLSSRKEAGILTCMFEAVGGEAKF